MEKPFCEAFREIEIHAKCFTSN